MLKEKVITIKDGGQEKRFRIRQMVATQAEETMFKFCLMLGAETDISTLRGIKDPYKIMSFILGAMSKQPYEKIQELLDILITSVSRIHDGGIESQLTSENVDSYVEEMGTLLRLRGEVIKINNFFPGSGSNDLPESPAQENIVIKKKS